MFSYKCLACLAVVRARAGVIIIEAYLIKYFIDFYKDIFILINVLLPDGCVNTEFFLQRLKIVTVPIFVSQMETFKLCVPPVLRCLVTNGKKRRSIEVFAKHISENETVNHGAFVMLEI